MKYITQLLTNVICLYFKVLCNYYSNSYILGGLERVKLKKKYLKLEEHLWNVSLENR